MNYKDSYQRIVLQYFKCQKFVGIPDYYNACHTTFNRMCGDEISVYVHIKEDFIENIRFVCDGCAITKASAALMSEIVLGKDLFFTKSIHDEFLSLIQGELHQIEHLGSLNIFSGIHQFPSRKQCVLLPWQALMTCIELPLLSCPCLR